MEAHRMMLYPESGSVLNYNLLKAVSTKWAGPAPVHALLISPLCLKVVISRAV
jgi:hypothetical protein